MANQPESHGSENRGTSKKDQNTSQSGSNTQMRSGQEGNMSAKDRSSDRTRIDQTSHTAPTEETIAKHSHAGTTGTGSGQISPKTQNESVPGRTPSRKDSEHKS